MNKEEALTEATKARRAMNKEEALTEATKARRKVTEKCLFS
jgi:hypothetical protein